jgi:hypothetical protein
VLTHSGYQNECLLKAVILQNCFCWWWSCSGPFSRNNSFFFVAIFIPVKDNLVSIVRILLKLFFAVGLGGGWYSFVTSQTNFLHVIAVYVAHSTC